MMNKKERELKLFELVRALSYTADILDMEKKIRLLKDEIESIDSETNEWNVFINTTTVESDEKDYIYQILKELEQNKKVKVANIDEINEKLNAYLGIVECLCNYIFLDKYLNLECIHLTNDEIDEIFIVEYIFIMSKIILHKHKRILFENMFENPEFFGKVVFKYYGAKSFDVMREITAEKHFIQEFEDYNLEN